MSPSPITENTLFYGDNLPILREYISDESIDLIYLDPPFNSNRSYNVLFKDESGQASDAQLTAFDDSWHWGEMAEATYHELVTQGPGKVSEAVGAMLQIIGRNQMMAYLVMMAARLVELHRVLKPTGSLYLHCDPTASHYLKIILDTIFGVENFRNEIIWKRTQAHNDPKRCGSVHDVILSYVKNYLQAVWYGGGHEVSTEYLNSHYRKVDKQGRRYQLIVCHAPGDGPPRKFFDKEISPPSGRHWTWTQENIDKLILEDRIVLTKSGTPRLIQFAPESVPLQDVWNDINPINSQAAERLGYPTQKPLALLERIIQASSNPGDIVLDPFCGCGTAIAAAEKLNRRWVGIDITHLAISLIRYRMKDAFPGCKYRVIGEPQDLGSATQLAQDDRFQFQWWALSLVHARPYGGEAGSKRGKKGADQGIDGVINFIDGAGGKPKRVLIQVKSGHVKSGDIRDLRGVIEREEAAIGVFLTLEQPSQAMIKEAVEAGYYNSPIWHKDYPRLQILTIEDLLAGKEIDMPPQHGTFKQAERIKKQEGKQGELGI
jgi:site-specific DNA-methyltransferase (adenine-specific)